MVYISASLSFFLATRTYTHTHTLILAHILYSTHPYIIHPEFAGPSTNCHSALCLLYIPLVQQINTMYDTGICTEFLFSIYIYSVFLMFLSSISTRFSTTLLYFTESSIFTARKLLFVFSSLLFSSLLFVNTERRCAHEPPSVLFNSSSTEGPIRVRVRIPVFVCPRTPVLKNHIHIPYSAIYSHCARVSAL